MTRHCRWSSLAAFPLLVLVLALGAPSAGGAAAAGKAAAKAASGFEGLPQWQPPAQHSVDLLMTHEGKSMTMTRMVDGGKVRSEMSVEGRKMIMLERPEDGGAIYNIMPEQKMVMKMTPPAAEPGEAPGDAPPVKVEKLGVEKLNGVAASKFRMSSEGHTVLGWFDAATGAPLRMESEGAVVEWKNFKPGAPPASAFELPKGYEVMDMDEQMKQMRKMGLGAGLPGGAGRGKAGMMGGMPGMGGGMAGGMGAQVGSGVGSGIGSGVGAAFGGPIGSMVGGYIGGQVGGWMGGKAADAAVPGRSGR